MHHVALEVSQVTDELDMPKGPVQAQGESLGSCPERTHVPNSL